MGHEDDFGTMLPGHVKKEGMTQLATGCLHGHLMFPRMSSGISFGDLTLQAKARGEPPDKGGVLSRRTTTQAVIEMAEDQLPAPG